MITNDMIHDEDFEGNYFSDDVAVKLIACTYGYQTVGATCPLLIMIYLFQLNLLGSSNIERRCIMYEYCYFIILFIQHDLFQQKNRNGKFFTLSIK